MQDDYFTIAREAVPSRSDARGGAVIRLGGEFDLSASDDLRAVLLDTVDAGGTTLIILDMGDVKFFDSEAINAVMEGYVAAEKVGITFRLARADGIVKRVFEVLGLAHLFGVDDPPDDAATH
ncbi:STAS domain-containing protein [Actinoplanes sp. NPDC024001]|uniref:STAS domain-containing protein n=1 Tax=Actinoplanes sp. NPDC024001 TaxID=3154598 RepID=UPI0033FAFB29